MAATQREPSSTAAKPCTPPPETSFPPEEAWARTAKWPNPPDPCNPDAATLRDQWRFATRKFCRWYACAWGVAAVAGLSLFAVGWLVKGSNPLPGRSPGPDDSDRHNHQSSSPSAASG